MDSGTLFDTPITDIQENVSVSGNTITGSLKYLDSGTIAENYGAGNFLALQISADDWNAYTSVMAGLDPSQEGLTEILTDEDKTGVWGVDDKDTQVFKMSYTDGVSGGNKAFDLSGLTLEDAGA